MILLDKLQLLPNTDSGYIQTDVDEYILQPLMYIKINVVFEDAMINKKDIQNLNGLLSLSMINDCQSKRKAAEALNTSIDTLNKYVSNLEAEIGFQLVNNTARGCQLTPKGFELLSGAVQIKDVLYEMYNKRSLRGGLKGEVRIGIPPAAASNLTTDGIDAFFDKYPDLKLILSSCIEPMCFEAMGTDVGLTCFEPKANSNMRIIAKKPLEYGFFASRGFIEKYGRPKNVDDMLENFRIVYKSNSSGYVQMQDNYLMRAKHLCIETNSHFDLAELVKSGAGIGIMPLCFRNPRLVYLDNLHCEAHAELYLLVNDKNRDLPRVRAVVDFLKERLFNVRIC